MHNIKVEYHGPKRYEAYREGQCGSFPVGRGPTILAALGDLMVHDRQAFGIELITSTPPSVCENWTKRKLRGR